MRREEMTYINQIRNTYCLLEESNWFNSSDTQTRHWQARSL